MKNILKNYIKEIHEMFSRGDAREESYYNILERLILNTSEIMGKTGIHVTIIPKKSEGGNPDFRVWDGKSKILGYFEAKKPGTDLDDVEYSEQLKRYKDTFPNLILTNFLEFRLYRDGQFVEKVSIGRHHTLLVVGARPVVENEEVFQDIFDKYFSFTFPQNLNARRLAKELAKRTRFLRDQVIIEELKEVSDDGHNHILGFYEAFKKYLIYGLTEDGFADLYSQTVTYGLFAARTRCKGEFHRKNAVDFIPRTIGILHDVFEFISMGKPSKQLEWIVDDIAEVLSSVNVSLILNEFYFEGKGEDPIVHFYETFLSEYDPKLREKRGVYYTPQPVVSFIVHSLNIILKKHFDKPDGLADLNVKVLDPAAGTLTFIAEAARLALEEYVKKYGEGVKEDFITNHLLKNFYAFELMMAPYAIGHLKMSYVFEEMGVRQKDEDRFKLYLTNTLEMQDIEQSHLPGMSTLSEESRLAGKVKKDTPILVILGNPPYSVSSSNKSDFIEEEMDVYKEDVKKERNIQPLSDDYIKFIRFAHWKIDQSGFGVIGMITNNSYLSGLIHRGMRKKLLESFNKIYILNLHGNSRIGERTPEGNKDENVFDIMQGVSIALFIKNEKSDSIGEVYYQDIWGEREEKYDYLYKNNINTIDWYEPKNQSPYYFFVKKDFSNQEEYNKFFKVTDIFEVWGSGVKTNRDHFLVDYNLDKLKNRINFMRDTSFDDEKINLLFSLKNGSYWNTRRERQKIRENTEWGNSFYKYSYRPFDDRWIYYQPNIIEIGRGGANKKVMKNIFKENIGLCVTRQLSTLNFYHSFITQSISDICYVSIKTKETGYIFPLYLYPDKNKKDLFSHMEVEQEKRANINRKIFDVICMGLRQDEEKITAEDIFYYIYGVLYSNIYREKYAEFLKIDFPRVPFTSDYELFLEMGKLGKSLADIHLMKSRELNQTFSLFEVSGDDSVKKVTYKDDEKRVYINENQYFSNIDKDIWEYQIGGYQVMYKWLKDRKGRTLSLEEIQHYIKISKALELTLKYQQKIDNLYPQIEAKLIELRA